LFNGINICVLQVIWHYIDVGLVEKGVTFWPTRFSCNAALFPNGALC